MIIIVHQDNGKGKLELCELFIDFIPQTSEYKPPPPEYNPPVYKPTTCTNAHLIKYKPPPPSPNISPSEYKPTCLSLLFITINYHYLSLLLCLFNTCLSLRHYYYTCLLLFTPTQKIVHVYAPPCISPSKIAYEII